VRGDDGTIADFTLIHLNDAGARFWDIRRMI
jgi:hypothetical protein